MEHIPLLLMKCFADLFHCLMQTTVRNPVAVELCSNGLISSEVRDEATRISGDPAQKAYIIVNTLFTQVNSSPHIILKAARVLSQNPAVNSTAMMMDTIYWRAFLAHQLSGTYQVS